MNLKKEVGIYRCYKRKDNVDHALRNHYLVTQLDTTQISIKLQDFILYLFGKLKVNITKNKVGIKSCRVYWCICIVPSYDGR